MAKRTKIVPVFLYGKLYSTLSGATQRMRTEIERIASLEKSLKGGGLTPRQRDNITEMYEYYKKEIITNIESFNSIKVIEDEKHINNATDFKGFM